LSWSVRRPYSGRGDLAKGPERRAVQAPAALGLSPVGEKSASCGLNAAPYALGQLRDSPRDQSPIAYVEIGTF
jgi:hypothetical protein